MSPKNNNQQWSVSSERMPPDHLRPKPLHPAVAQQPNVWLLLNALKKKWMPAVVLGLPIAAAVFIGLWLYLPDSSYTARAVFRVHASKPRVFWELDDEKNFDIFRRTQQAMIRDPSTLASAIDTNVTLKIKDKEESYILGELPEMLEKIDPVQWLEQNVNVSLSGPEMIQISMSWSDDDLPTKVVHSISEVFARQIKSSQSDGAKQRVKELEKIEKKYEGKVKAKDDRIKAALVVLEVGSAELFFLKQKFALLELQSVRQELAALHSELRNINARLEFASIDNIFPGATHLASFGMLPANVSPWNLTLGSLLQKEVRNAELRKIPGIDAAVSNFLEEHPELSAHKKRMKEWEDYADALKRIQNPSRSSKQLEDAAQTLTKLRGEYNSKEQRARLYFLDTYHYSNTIPNENLPRYKLLNQKNILEKQIASLEEEEKTLEEKNQDLNKHSYEVESLQKEKTELDETRKQIQKKIEMIEVETDHAAPRIERIGTVPIVQATYNTKKLLMSAGGAGASLALVLLGFAWFEFRSRKVYSTSEVVHDLGIPLFGTLPDHSAKSGWLFSRSKKREYDRLLTDSVDAIRAMLLFTARMEPMKVLMVTSADAGEGKTTSATHLAASLARVGKRTLLIDCDLRKPRVHSLFSLPVSPGFSELLREESSVRDSIATTSIPNLSVLTAGVGDLTAVQLLSTDRLTQLLNEFREDYDFIIVDSSPILPVPDGIVVSQRCDGVIFSILRDVSRIPKVYAAYQKLIRVSSRILGAIVSGTNGEGDTSYSRYAMTTPTPTTAK